MPLKVSEMIKLVDADGWYLTEVKGGHRQFKHPVRLSDSGCRRGRRLSHRRNSTRLHAKFKEYLAFIEPSRFRSTARRDSRFDLRNLGYI